MTEEKNHFRDRKFRLLLYPEDETHAKALEHIRRNYDYALICHNRDPDENGEIKKAHYHVVIRVDGQNAIWNTSLAKDLEITPNYIRKCSNLDRALMYLIHYNEPDKVQYKVTEVSGTLVKRLKQAIAKDDKTEQEKVAELIEVINNVNGKIRFTDVVNCALAKGYYDVIRRASGAFMKLVDEHNQLFDLINSCQVDENLNEW